MPWKKQILAIRIQKENWGQEPLSVTFENPATEPKIRISFYLPKRTLLVNYFQK